MQRATQIDIIRRYLALDASGQTQLQPAVHTIPAEHYLSDERVDAECRRLMGEQPVLACLGVDVAEPGQFVTLESDGVPLVVLRGSDGVLRAFVNICRHRAHPVADGCGQTRALVCPFHSWTYRLDGSLSGRPRSLGGFDDIGPESLGLLPAPVAEARGLVFVRARGDQPIDAEAHLAGLGPEIGNYDLDRYVPYARRSSSWNANWKLIVDTYMESYHVFSLHSDSVGPDYPGHVMVFDGVGPHLRFPVPRASLLALRDRPEHEWDLLAHATVQYLLAPNAILNHTVDHVLTWRFIPRGPARTDIEMAFYVPRDRAGETAYWDEWVDLHVNVTYLEDFPASERIHRALASGAIERTLLGRNEIAVMHFHQALDRLLAEP